MANKLKEFIAEVKPKVDAFIAEILKGEPKKLYDAAYHLPSVGGKRLRPALVIMVARTLGATFEEALAPAASVELLHNFTLVHDDIMDKDEKRRGVPTVHVLYGEPMAILAGDVLYAKAYEALLKAPQRPDIVVEMTRMLTWAAVTVAEGQALDMMFEDRWDVSEEEYIEMVKKKTGALFGASAALGALSASKPELKDLLKEFGILLGIAFQIKDDILSLVGDEKVTGKKKYNDLKEGKKTLLVIKALERLSEEEKKKLMSILGNQNATDEELAETANLIIKSGALDYALKKADEIGKRALEILNSLPTKNPEYLELLKELVDFAVKREY
ncbi:geranylgeranyl pyrophosphate synthase [Ignicoccus pacificus DSM 13166]|uniref:Geranylgeranyl pyrophosphate synthase n=1 Tax=Ignicoccus pacificus DSM 13166 TaxID=940294 RepID=A0A977PJP8_9CREN|nr:geranylgeranyl pyrophosphate synthase [Ignicoccus pacificus DSM 13166]